MLFLPYEKIVYDSPLSPEEVVRKLERFVEPGRQIEPDISIDIAGIDIGANRQYTGTVQGRNFTLHRMQRRRRSGNGYRIVPIIKGLITEREGGSRILVRMRLSIPGQLISIAFVIAYTAIVDGRPLPASLLTLLYISFMAYCAVLLLFKIGSTGDEKLLQELFRAAPKHGVAVETA